MAKPTSIQTYFLILIGYMRWFGAIFAAIAFLITASNLPGLIRVPRLLTFNIAGGTGFLIVGIALYVVGTAIQRRYRAYIQQQID
jgi:hypothetical protein